MLCDGEYEYILFMKKCQHLYQLFFKKILFFFKNPCFSLLFIYFQLLLAFSIISFFSFFLFFSSSFSTLTDSYWFFAPPQDLFSLWGASTFSNLPGLPVLWSFHYSSPSAFPELILLKPHDGQTAQRIWWKQVLKKLASFAEQKWRQNFDWQYCMKKQNSCRLEKERKK